jgi:hypothetical protein
MTKATTLPAEVRALAVMLVMIVAGRLGLDEVPRFLPFLPLLDSLGTQHQWARVLLLFWCLGCGLILSGRWIRMGCALAGGVELLRVLGNIPHFSNGRLLDASLFLLIALYFSPRGLTFLRTQYLLLYAGASANKALDPDWWNGRFVAATFDYHLPLATAQWATRLAMPAGLVAMFVEAALFFLLLVPRWRVAGILLLVGFHTGLIVMLHEDFATFYYTVGLGGILLFLPTPAVRELTLPNRLWVWVAKISCFSNVQEATSAKGPATLSWGKFVFHGPLAYLFLVLISIPGAALLVGALTTLSRLRGATAREMALAVLLPTVIALLCAGRWEGRRATLRGASS